MISTELNRIIGAKDAIRASIIGKGVQVPSSATIDDYSAYIDLIQQGSGSSITTTSITINQNGTYNAPIGSAYTQVIVNVDSGSTSGHTSGGTIPMPTSANTIYYRAWQPENDVFYNRESGFCGAIIVENSYIDKYGREIGNYYNPDPYDPPYEDPQQGLGTLLFDRDLTGVTGEVGFSKVLTFELSLPQSITTIGEKFYYNTHISSVTIPDHVTTLSPSAISSSHILQELYIGSGITTLDGSCLLYHCPNVKKVTFGENITNLGNLFYLDGTDGHRDINKLVFKGMTPPTITNTNLRFYVAGVGTIYAPQGSDYSGIQAMLGNNWTLTYV